jgi:hypothetical protein
VTILTLHRRKETTDEKYFAINIFRFYIRCTSCSAEITFKTDPKNLDYVCEKGAKRNFELWREAKQAEETEEERLNRLEMEEAEKNAMAELESKTLDAKQEMKIADALDEIRTRNARNERLYRENDVSVARDSMNEERERQEQEDAEAARIAFSTSTEERIRQAEQNDGEASVDDGAAVDAGAFTKTVFKRTVKKKKDFSAALGIKKKVS